MLSVDAPLDENVWVAVRFSPKILNDGPPRVGGAGRVGFEFDIGVVDRRPLRNVDVYETQSA
jgi:hypothetical protein